jgi:hypothetical protein
VGDADFSSANTRFETTVTKMVNVAMNRLRRVTFMQARVCLG